MQKFEYRYSLAECTVSSGADHSERSENKNGTKNFWGLTYSQIGIVRAKRSSASLYHV